MKIAVIGGCGHVGLPLGIALASRGGDVTLLDIDSKAVATVNAGDIPFKEDGAAQALREAVQQDRLRATTEPSSLAGTDIVIVVIGTPVDEHLNPDPTAIPAALDPILPHLRDGQLVVLRSTIYPGVTKLVEQSLAAPASKSTLPSVPSASPRARR